MRLRELVSFRELATTCVFVWMNSVRLFGVNQPPKDLQWRYSCFMGIMGFGKWREEEAWSAWFTGCLTVQCKRRVGVGCLVIRGRVMGGLWERGSARPGLCMLAWLALSPDNGGRGRLSLSLLSFRGALDPLSYEFSGCGGLSWRSAPLLWGECPLWSMTILKWIFSAQLK